MNIVTGLMFQGVVGLDMTQEGVETSGTFIEMEIDKDVS